MDGMLVRNGVQVISATTVTKSFDPYEDLFQYKVTKNAILICIYWRY